MENSLSAQVIPPENNPPDRFSANFAKFPSLTDETRELIPTACAAYHLNRSGHTLRIWAYTGGGLLRPVRIGRRLGWPTAEIRRLVAGGAK